MSSTRKRVKVVAQIKEGCNRPFSFRTGSLLVWKSTGAWVIVADENHVGVRVFDSDGRRLLWSAVSIEEAISDRVLDVAQF